MQLKQNIQMDKSHLGWAFENVDGAFTKAYLQFVNNFEGNSQYWGRANYSANTETDTVANTVKTEVDYSVSAGCKIDHGKFCHSYEAEIGLGDKSSVEGFQESPVSLIMGGEYELSDKTNVSYTMRLAKTTQYGQKVSH